MTRYWKTTLAVTLVEESHEDGPPEYHGLAGVAYAITDGGAVGDYTTEQTELTPRETAALLTELGSEPGFFQLNVDGTPVGEDP